MRTARLAPEAEAELREAAAWYKKGSPDVARRFLSEVRSLAREVARIPLRFPVLVEPELDPPIRRALVPGFPYALIFSSWPPRTSFTCSRSLISTARRGTGSIECVDEGRVIVEVA